MHRLWVVWRFLLVPVDLLVSQLPIEVVLVEGEGEGELDVIRKLAFKHVEPLHLNHEDPRHYSIQPYQWLEKQSRVASITYESSSGIGSWSG